VALAQPLLRVWLGQEFALHAAPVLRLLGLGILFYSLDIVANGLLDGLGRPAFNARLALLEIAILIPLLLVLLPMFGVVGAAASWVLRVVFSFALRLWVLVRVFPEARAALRRLAPVFGVSVLALAAALTGPVAAGVGFLLTAFIAWMRGLDGPERATVLARLRRGAAS
jgi:O-antigen/teichoic acid export membrane protein